MKNEVRRLKKKIIGILFLFCMGIGMITATRAEAAEITEPAEKTITRIEVTDTALEIPFGSKFDQSDIHLLVYYSDGTTATAQPDAAEAADTTKLGSQTLSVRYQGMSVIYTVSVVPRQVTGVRMKKGTKTSMTIGWNKLEEAEEYEVYTSTKKDGTPVLETSTEKNEYTFQDMEPGQILYVWVKAVSKDISGEMSEVIAVAPKPGKVTGVKATAAVKTKVTLSWKKTEGATGYAVYYRLSTKSAYTYAGSTTSLSYKVTELSSGRNYYFIVYAYGADLTNLGDGSDASLYGTAPAIPNVIWRTIPEVVSAADARFFAKDGLTQKKKYYVKVVSVRTVSGMELTSTSVVKSATTKKAKATSTSAKLYKSKKKFKKSKAYKKYAAFRKKVSYKKSFIVPGLTNTNVAGFNAGRMVPQSITFAGNYLLISAYDYSKAQESVIYVMNKKTQKYITTIVLPHKGHVGGITFDGTNLWIAYGKNLQCLKFSTVQAAVNSKRAFTEITRFTTVCPMPDTVSYVSYYKGKIWAGAYNEKVQKYMYGYSIVNKQGVPSLAQTNRILMPNRTQGVAFTSDGKMIVSRSCQTDKGKSGFLSQLVTYKPTWNLSSPVIKKNKKKKVVKMPPMNEGIAISGSYTYVIFESTAFSACKAPVDRVAAFKTSKIS